MKRERLQRIWESNYFLTAMMCFLAWVISCVSMENALSKDKVIFSLGLIFAFFAVIVYYMREGFADRREEIVLLILAGAFLVRLVYVWCIPYNISPHDLGMISKTPELHDGHLGYIGYVYHNKKLPDMDPTTVWSFYNPPLFYVLGAIWLKINTVLRVGWDQAVENLQFLPLLFTMWATVGVDGLLKEFRVRGTSRYMMLAFFSFFPAFIWISGTVSTDALALFWMVHIVLYTVRWYRKRDCRTIILLALCISLGMLTKVSIGLMSLGTAVIFLWVLVEEFRKDRKRVLRYIKQFALFLVICLPLGLYWALRCALRFNMSITYVPDPATYWQYFGDKPFWEVWGIPSAKQLDHAETLFDMGRDSNVWLVMIRNALFDEYATVELPTAPAEFAGRILLYMQFPLILFMNGCYAVVLFRKKCKMVLASRFFVGIVYLLLLVSYISLIRKLPYICTASFRYIAVSIVFPCLGTAVFFRNRVKTKLFKIFCIYTSVSLALGVILYMRYCFM